MARPAVPLGLWLVACAAPPSAEPTPDAPCRPWLAADPGPARRHQAVADAVIPTTDGARALSEVWDGCGPHGFLVSDLPRAEAEPASVWKRDLRALLDASPPDTHWWFVPRGPRADAHRSELVKDIDDLDPGLADAWADRLHVLDVDAGALDGWLGEALTGVGTGGFALDLRQRIRGLGSAADVTRDARGEWPWENNLAYFAHDLAWLVEDEARTAAWEAAAPGATDVRLWDGEVLSGFAEIDVALPPAEAMADFDTLTLEIDLRCPDPTRAEPGNCGAWDYLAHLSRVDGPEPVELARFITPYHREARWRVDITPMLPHLADGGSARLRWEFAPEWNPQPTETRITLRLADTGRPVRPQRAVRVGRGGPFGGAPPPQVTTVDIPSDAAATTLYAVITGHGGATRNCAEFCDHQHAFAIGDDRYTAAHPEAGTATGCLDRLGEQVVPNQWGTWWFGRGGWCPGQPVSPWNWDLTDAVSPGTSATVTYTTSLAGAPSPADAGDVRVDAWLVTWAATEGSP